MKKLRERISSQNKFRTFHALKKELRALKMYDDYRSHRGRRRGRDRVVKFEIYPNYYDLVTSVIYLVIGVVFRVVNSQFDNSSIFKEDHSCPIMEGRISNWIWNEANVLIVYGGIGLASSGFMPRLFMNCQMFDEAFCLGKMFMGFVGDVSIETCTN